MDNYFMGQMIRLLVILPILFTSVNSLPSGSSSAVLTPFNNVGDVANEKIGQIINSKVLSFSPTFPDSGRKHAVIEHESLVSKADSAYGSLQNFVAGFFNPKPIVDTIQEHEKYGNDGDKFRSVGVAAIGGFEGLSNILNAAVEVPFETVRQLGRKFSNSFSTYGAKLVGI